MNNLQVTLRNILKAMCSEYNGIQVFLFSSTLFYWLSSASLVWSFTSLVSLRIHYLPLVFFLVLFAYVCFLILKIYTCMFQGPHVLYPLRLEEFMQSVIRLHWLLFVTLITLMVFYVLSKFLAYFYGIQLPLNLGVWLTFRTFTVILILYYYMRSTWLKPMQNMNFSMLRSERYLKAWISRYPFAALKYSVMVLVVLLAAVRLYQLIIAVLFIPGLDYLNSLAGFGLTIELVPVTGMLTVFYNVFMLGVAFMLSNLLFYPIIILGQMLVNALHPIRFKQVTNA